MNLAEKINGGDRRAVTPEPNEVDSNFVMDCLDTDSEGDGMLFAGLLENKLLYAAASGCWFLWRGNVWRRDKVELIYGLVRYVTERYGKEIKSLENDIEESRKNNSKAIHEDLEKALKLRISTLDKKIKALRQEKGRNACIKFSHTYYNNPFAIEGSEFDKNPWLLGVQNGVVDLRSGELYEGKPDQLVSKQCSCDYPGLDIDTSPWREFVSAIFNDDQELIDFMQRLTGYAITGKTHIHVFPFLLGRGRNGKSLFVNTIMRVLADYAAKIPSELFLKNNQSRSANQTDPAIMKLEGLRFALANEVEAGSLLSEKEVNRITGGDILEGRNPYDKELRNFDPSHFAMMVGNHEPVPPRGADGFWDRTLLIKFVVRFVKSDPDPAKNERLADPKIEESLMGMDGQALAWMVKGCLLFQEDEEQLYPPTSVLKETEEYRNDANWVRQFVDACCERGEEDVNSTQLYLVFVEWYRERLDARKGKTLTQKVFGREMRAAGYQTRRHGKEGIMYIGLKVNGEWKQKLLEAAHVKSGSQEEHKNF